MFKPSHIICGLAATISMSFAQANVNINDETQRSAVSLGASRITEITHKEGQSKASSAELDEVRKLIQEAKAVGKIDEVKIISWADREYPAEGQAASKGDMKLADARADYLKNYVKSKLGVRSVATYNMAKRPNAVQELFDTTQARVKEGFERSGAAPSTQAQTGFLGFKGKASESLILVYVK